MRLHTTLATVVLLSAASGVRAQLSGNDSIQVGIFGYDRDGTVVVSAWDPVPSKKSMVFASGFCRVGAGFRDLPEYATDAWRFSWTAVSITEQTAVIQLDWQRVLDARQPVTAPGGSVQLTLQWGEKVVLDTVADQLPSGCGGQSMTFEARYGIHPMRVSVRGNASGNAAKSTGSQTATPKWAQFKPAFSVKLWFMRRVPGKPDEVLAQPALLVMKEGTFAFAPVRINVTDGTVVVVVHGSFSIDNDGSGGRLTFVTERRAEWQSLQTNRDRPPELDGSSRTTIPLPGPDEVISFEMPPIRFNGRRALPDQFAIRVQITPQ
jgi:hypothetical protein